MKNKYEATDNVASYKNTIVVTSKHNGEIGLALPLFTDDTGHFLGEDDRDSMIGYQISLGIYSKVGYLVVAPEMSPTFLNNEGFDDNLIVIGDFNESD